MPSEWNQDGLEVGGFPKGYFKSTYYEGPGAGDRNYDTRWGPGGNLLNRRGFSMTPADMQRLGAKYGNYYWTPKGYKQLQDSTPGSQVPPRSIEYYKDAYPNMPHQAMDYSPISDQGNPNMPGMSDWNVGNPSWGDLWKAGADVPFYQLPGNPNPATDESMAPNDPQQYYDSTQGANIPTDESMIPNDPQQYLPSQGSNVPTDEAMAPVDPQVYLPSSGANIPTDEGMSPTDPQLYSQGQGSNVPTDESMIANWPQQYLPSTSDVPLSGTGTTHSASSSGGTFVHSQNGTFFKQNNPVNLGNLPSSKLSARPPQGMFGTNPGQNPTEVQWASPERNFGDPISNSIDPGSPGTSGGGPLTSNPNEPGMTGGTPFGSSLGPGGLSMALPGSFTNLGQMGGDIPFFGMRNLRQISRSGAPNYGSHFLEPFARFGAALPNNPSAEQNLGALPLPMSQWGGIGMGGGANFGQAPTRFGPNGRQMSSAWRGRGFTAPASLQPTQAADYISAGQTQTSPGTDKEIAAISPQETIFNPKQLGALSVAPSQKHKLLRSQVKAIFAAKKANL